MTAVNPAIAMLQDPGFSHLKQHLITFTGLAYYENKDDELAAHLGRRLKALGMTHCAAYEERLHDAALGPAELDILASHLTVGETFFFRHRELFDALRERVIPDIIERNRETSTIRIWSAGCSIGAEVYSLSILLQQEFGPRLANWDVTLLGTDINRQFLAQAQKGVFGEWSFRTVGDDVKEACFTRHETGWLINPEYRQRVSFQCHNLVQNPFPSRVNNLAAFDLILCRNVMIYFAPDVIRRLVTHFYDCLVDGGWFLVGHAEPNIELFQAFRTVNAPGVVLYQRPPRPAPAGTNATPLGRDELAGPSPRPTTPAASATLDWNAWPFIAGPAPWQTVPVPADPTSPPAPLTLPTVPPGPPSPLPGPLPWAGAPTELPGNGSGGIGGAGPHVTTGEYGAPPGREPTLADIRRLLDEGSTAGAERACQRLLEIDGLNPRVHFYHALIQEQTGRHQETLDSLRRAIYLDRSFELAHYYLGLSLQRLGESTAARRAFRNVLALLSDRDGTATLAEADELTVEGLRQLTDMQLGVLAQ